MTRVASAGKAGQVAMAGRKTETLRAVGPADVRALIVRHQGWDPVDLDPNKIQPLSEKAKRHPLMRLLPADRRFCALSDEPGLGAK